MVYLKSILTGLGAMAIVAVVGGLWMQSLQYRTALSGVGAVAVGIDIRAVVCVLLLAFVAGFWWRFRKAR